MKLTAIAASLILAYTALAIPHPPPPKLPKVINSASQVQKISVDQSSGYVYLEVDGGKVKLGNVNTGNLASVDADQSLHQRGFFDKPSKQVNKAKQTQKISIDQESGYVYLEVDGGKVKLGDISTSNGAFVSSDQSLHQRGFHDKPSKDTNKAIQTQKIKIDQTSGDVEVYVEGHGYLSLGSINTGNAATVYSPQSLHQGRGFHEKPAKSTTNKAIQTQKISIDQTSGDVTLWVDGHGFVSIGNINTGNIAVVNADQSLHQRGFHDKPSKDNKAMQKQKIKVDQTSGSIDLWVDGHGYVSIGSLSTGNSAWVGADQSLHQ